MHICYISMRKMEEFKLPKLFTVSGYTRKELNELMDFISAQFFLICAKWKQAFVEDEIKFYC